MYDISKTRAAALLAVLALGAGGGLLAGCGGDSEKTSDDTVPTAVTTSEDGGAVTVPSRTDGETVTAEDVQTLPTPTGTNGSGGGTSTGASTTKGSSTTGGSSTVPGGSPSTAPEDTGGSAAPDDNGRTTTSGSGSSGGADASQDPDCKPGTGPGQPLPQCEPVSGEDAQENEG